MFVSLYRPYDLGNAEHLKRLRKFLPSILTSVLGIYRGEAKEDCWWGVQPQFTDKQTSFKPNLPTNRTDFPRVL